jgi:pimeloyl-ACP methyl ester carboxylesterase
MRFLAAALVAAASVAAIATAPAAATFVADGQGMTCLDEKIPVALAAGQAADQEIYGRLCYQGRRPPESVQLLVAGLTYNHYYWDVPGYGGRYSYVRHAVDTGYATFDVDPLGTGLSSHPLSTQVTIQANAFTLHQVIAALRAGRVGPRAFGRVVYVGHSLGAETGWVEAATYHDVDALVATATLHAFNKDTVVASAAYVQEASADPAFAALHLDSGYVTTLPGARARFFYNPDFADPSVIAFDESHKDVGSTTESAGSAGLVAGDPANAMTRNIDVPVLVVVGSDDLLHCGGTGGENCGSAASVAAFEAPYYSPAAHLGVVLVPKSGHDVALAPNAPWTDASITAWLRTHVRAGSLSQPARTTDPVRSTRTRPGLGLIPLEVT